MLCFDELSKWSLAIWNWISGVANFEGVFEVGCICLREWGPGAEAQVS